MSFRTISIEKATRINLDLNNIAIYFDKDYYYINLDEIDSIILEDPRCHVSLKLLSALCEKGINVIFTDDSHMPVGCLTTLTNHARATKKLKQQIEWSEDAMSYLWTEVVKQKIKSQIEVLKNINKITKIKIMEQYITEIKQQDSSNREGLASRIYFKEVFGNDFKRFNEDIINFMLNYSYQIIRSKISQEIIALGYNPSLGINHKSEYNYFNLADDFIEIFRPIVDYYVFKIVNNTDSNYLTPDIKEALCNIINQKTLYKNQEYKIHTVIQYYLQDMFSFLETGDISKIKFPELICII